MWGCQSTKQAYVDVDVVVGVVLVEVVVGVVLVEVVVGVLKVSD